MATNIEQYQIEVLKQNLVYDIPMVFIPKRSAKDPNNCILNCDIKIHFLNVKKNGKMHLAVRSCKVEMVRVQQDSGT